MQFYETDFGNEFFNAQLPALINALKDIAGALNRPDKPALRLPMEVSPDYLKEFYYGNLEPSEQVMNDAIRQMTREAIEMQEKLREQLSAENWELVTELTSLIDKRSLEECAASFQIGFCTAMQMLAAGLTGTDTEINITETAAAEITRETGGTNNG